MADQHVTENWRPVVGFEGLYEVSDLGRVKGLLSGRVLRPGVQRRGGHLVVALVKAGARSTRTVHRLVLEAFVGIRPPGGVCRHFPDRNPANNCLLNLRWGTQKQNGEDMTVHGTSAKGSRNGASKLTELNVRDIRALRDAGASIKEIAARFSVSRVTANEICAGRRWGWLKFVSLKSSAK